MRVIGLPFFILLVIVAVMVIFTLINKLGWKSLFILLALPVVFMLLAHNPSRVQVNVIDHVPTQSWPSSTSTSSTLPAIWTEGIENEFEADIYPSRESAARALAQQAAPLLSTVTPNQTLPTSVEVYGEEISIQLLNVFADKLREQTGLSPILVQPIQPQQTLLSDPNVAVIAMDFSKWEQTHRPYDEYVLQAGSGALRIRIKWANDQQEVIRSTEIVEKPWVQNLNSYLNENPNAHLVVARSNETCTDQLEARKQAMNSALSVVQTVIAQGTPSGSTNRSAINAISEQDLTQYHLILDQFSQSFNSSTSRIWRHAILLNLNTDKLTPLFQDRLKTTATERVSQSETWAKQFGSLAGLALVVFILYIFLNAATKGYYTWSLRIAAVILVGVFIFAVLRFV